MNKKISLNAKIRWPDVKDNYVVSYAGHDIGGVYRSETAWTWSVTVPMALSAWSTGSAPNLQDGIKALANAWTRILKQPTLRVCNARGTLKRQPWLAAPRRQPKAAARPQTSKKVVWRRPILQRELSANAGTGLGV